MYIYSNISYTFTKLCLLNYSGGFKKTKKWRNTKHEQEAGDGSPLPLPIKINIYNSRYPYPLQASQHSPASILPIVDLGIPAASANFC